MNICLHIYSIWQIVSIWEKKNLQFFQFYDGSSRQWKNERKRSSTIKRIDVKLSNDLYLFMFTRVTVRKQIMCEFSGGLLVFCCVHNTFQCLLDNWDWSLNKSCVGFVLFSVFSPSKRFIHTTTEFWILVNTKDTDTHVSGRVTLSLIWGNKSWWYETLCWPWKKPN